jgi:hypothetical protein
MSQPETTIVPPANALTAVQREQFAAAYRRHPEIDYAAQVAGVEQSVARATGRAWLAQPEVWAAIVAPEPVADLAECCRVLTDMVRAVPADFYEADGQLRPAADWNQRHAVRELTANSQGVTAVKLHDKLAAIKLLAERLGWAPPAAGDVPPVTVGVEIVACSHAPDAEGPQ